jgi:hypothetical protein
MKLKEIPVTQFLQTLTQKHRCSYKLIGNTVTVKSNRGSQFVDSFISDMLTTKSVFFKYREFDKTTSAGILFSDFQMNERLEKFLARHFAFLGYRNLNVTLREIDAIITTRIENKMPSQETVMNEIKKVRRITLTCKTPNHLALIIEENSSYFVIPAQNKKECYIFSFENLESIKSQQYIFSLKQVLNANRIECSRGVIGYLREYDSMFNNLLDDKIGCAKLKMKDDGYRIVFSKFMSPDGLSTVEQLVKFRIDAVNVSTYDVDDAKDMAKFLTTKFKKICALDIDRHKVQVSTSLKRNAKITNFMYYHGWSSIKEVKVSKGYLAFLNKFHRYPPSAGQCEVAVSKSHLLILSRSEDALQQVEQDFIAASRVVDNLLNGETPQIFECTKGEYNLYEDCAQWAANKNSAVKFAKKTENGYLIYFKGAALSGSRAFEDFSQCTEKPILIDLGNYMTKRNIIKKVAKTLHVSIVESVELVKENQIVMKILFRGLESSIAEIELRL